MSSLEHNKTLKYILLSALLLILCGMFFSVLRFFGHEKYIHESYNIDNALEDMDKNERYDKYLARVTEEDFLSEEKIASADAIVSYDEATEQYSIELSLTTNEELDGEQIELYKSILSKMYEGTVTLVVDGKIM